MRQILATAALVCMAANGTALAADNESVSRHGAWETRTLTTDDGPRFRSSASFREDADHVVINLDRVPGDCGPFYMSMNVHLDEPAERTYQVEERFGQMRIDEGSIHDLSYTVDFRKGEPVTIVTVTKIKQPDGIAQELREGHTMRFRLVTPDNEVYLRYDLTGVEAALQDSLQRCQAYEAPKAEKKKDGDASFFGGSAEDRGYFQRRER